MPMHKIMEVTYSPISFPIQNVTFLFDESLFVLCNIFLLLCCCFFFCFFFHTTIFLFLGGKCFILCIYVLVTII